MAEEASNVEFKEGVSFDTLKAEIEKVFTESKVSQLPNKYKATGVCKPVLRFVQNKGVAVGDLPMEEIQYIIDKDRELFDKYLADTVDYSSALTDVFNRYGLRWFSRLPEWLANSFAMVDADGYYKFHLLLDAKLPYFDLEDMPTISAVIAHVKPSNYVPTVKNTYLGKITLLSKYKEPLSMEETIAVFGKVASLEDPITGNTLGSLKLNVPKEFVDFIQDLEPMVDRDLITSIADVACSTTPYESALNFLFSHAEEGSLSMESTINFKLLASSLDSELGLIVRANKKPILTHEQAIESLSKFLNKYSLGRRLKEREVYLMDYIIWNNLRYVDNPLNTAVAFNRNVNYIKDFRGRMKKRQEKYTLKPKA